MSLFNPIQDPIKDLVENLSKRDVISAEEMIEIIENKNRLPEGTLESGIDKFLADPNLFFRDKLSIEHIATIANYVGLEKIVYSFLYNKRFDCHTFDRITSLLSEQYSFNKHSNLSRYLGTLIYYSYKTEEDWIDANRRGVFHHLDSKTFKFYDYADKFSTKFIQFFIKEHLLKYYYESQRLNDLFCLFPLMTDDSLLGILKAELCNNYGKEAELMLYAQGRVELLARLASEKQLKSPKVERLLITKGLWHLSSFSEYGCHNENLATLIEVFGVEKLLENFSIRWKNACPTIKLFLQNRDNSLIIKEKLSDNERHLVCSNGFLLKIAKENKWKFDFDETQTIINAELLEFI